LTVSIASKLTSVKVPGGTPIMVRLINEVSSATVAVGQSIDFKVVGDVVINGTTVVKDGTLGHAQIVALDKRQMLGEPGSVTLGDFYVLALDGSRIPLSATINNVGKSKQTTALVLAWFICLPFLLMKGGDATIPAGTEKTVYTAATVTVDIE
jgi:hypothetical protein